MRKWILSFLLSTLALAANAADEPLIFAVNEGTTYRASTADTKSRYDGMADDLSKLLRRRVQVEPVIDYATLTNGLADKRYALAYVHPAQVSIRAMRGGYRLLALTKGYVDVRATFFVPAASPLRSIADLKGRKLAAPDQDSITSWMVRATLRDALGTAGPSEVIYTRYQDAIPFIVEQGLADIGTTSSSSVLKEWADKSGRIIGTSKAVPIKHLLASGGLTADQFKLVQDYFLNLEGSAAGRARLEQIKVTGFIGFDDNLLLGIGKWLGI